MNLAFILTDSSKPECLAVLMTVYSTVTKVWYSALIEV